VIHVAFNKNAGTAPLKELLHSDSVLWHAVRLMSHPTGAAQPMPPLRSCVTLTLPAKEVTEATPTGGCDQQ
jgi:hypothetical protein